MKGLFTSQDSKFALRTAFLVTLVPLVMILIIFYSVWLMLSMNFSYFRANGFPLGEQSMQDFINYLLQSQIDYVPYVGLFLIGVFFIGLFLSHIILRPFHQLVEICHELKSARGEKIRIVGLGKQKLLIKLGNFLSKYAESRRNETTIQIPNELQKIQAPVMDWVFYFQFFCLIFILMAITVTSIYVFTNQLQESIIQAALTMLKAPKGMATFLESQKNVFELVVLVPSVVSFVFYCVIARMIISRVQGVTYGYVRDVCDVVRGNTSRRLTPRQEDPGRAAAVAVNELLDLYHPRRTQKEVETPEASGNLATHGA